MEVQLHIHSQWLNAKYKDSFVQVTDKWNIGQLSTNNQKKIFHDCLDCIKSIINNSNNTNLINSFKAGSWGLRPFNALYDEYR